MRQKEVHRVRNRTKRGKLNIQFSYLLGLSKIVGDPSESAKAKAKAKKRNKHADASRKRNRRK